jgi:GT2 family glycosyltransferase
MTRLRIVIVNWNAGDQLAQCLQSIVLAECSGFDLERVVVVDNASSDDSLEGIENFPLPLHIIRNDRNRGFAAACNQGAAECSADYLLFLNPDTRLHADSLRLPLQFMAAGANAKVGICGIALLDETATVARSCARFPAPSMFYAAMLGLDRIWPRLGHFMREWDHADTRAVDHVIGAFFLLRHSLFTQLGGFDERFFVYLEDLDFSLRARRAGWSSAFLAEASAYHKGGGTSEQVKATRLFYALRSRLLYVHKHYSTVQALGLSAATLTIELPARLALALLRADGPALGETLAAYRMLWRDVPQIWSAARR